MAEGRGGLLKSRNSLSLFCLNGLIPYRHFVAPPLKREEIPIAQQIFSPIWGVDVWSILLKQFIIICLKRFPFYEVEKCETSDIVEKIPVIL